MYLVWAWMMRWMNGGGDGDSSAVQRQLQTLQDQMQDNHNSDLIMQGIQGNTNAIREFATRTGCDLNAINTAICGVSSSIAQLGGQLGFSTERVINAVNSGDASVIQALKDCCCTTQKLVIEQGYQNQLANERQTYAITNSVDSVGRSVERGFCDTAYAAQTQASALSNTIKDTGNANTAAIISKLNEMQNQGLLDKIDALREKNSEQAVIINNAQQSALFGQMITQATAPINAGLASLTKEVADIQCKLPQTVTLPFSCATAVPTNALYNGFLFNNGFGTWNNGSLWG